MDSENSYHVRNVSEDLVEIYLDDCIKKSDMCNCARCRADVKAFALNTLPPRYVVTDFGDALTRALSLSIQFQADIISTIIQSIKLVKEKPHHD